MCCGGGGVFMWCGGDDGGMGPASDMKLICSTHHTVSLP